MHYKTVHFFLAPNYPRFDRISSERQNKSAIKKPEKLVLNDDKKNFIDNTVQCTILNNCFWRNNVERHSTSAKVRTKASSCLHICLHKWQYNISKFAVSRSSCAYSYAWWNFVLNYFDPEQLLLFCVFYGIWKCFSIKVIVLEVFSGQA